MEPQISILTAINEFCICPVVVQDLVLLSALLSDRNIQR